MSKIESVEENKVLNRILYQEAIESLLSLAQVLRPDINYAIYAYRRYINNHGQSHLNAVKRIFRYLQETSGVKLIFHKLKASKVKDYELTGYCDSDFRGNDSDDRKSIIAYLFQTFGNLVSWTTVHQPMVALSTNKAEYVIDRSSTGSVMDQKSS